jgi:hypothetical protein
LFACVFCFMHILCLGFSKTLRLLFSVFRIFGENSVSNSSSIFFYLSSFISGTQIKSRQLT